MMERSSSLEYTTEDRQEAIREDIERYAKERVAPRLARAATKSFVRSAESVVASDVDDDISQIDS